MAGPARRVPSGNRTRHLAPLEDLLGPLQGLAVGRLAMDGKGPDVEQQAAQPLLLPQGVLGHEEELALGAEGGEPEVGEGAVHRGQDHGAAGRHVLAADHLGPEPAAHMHGR